MRVIFTDLELVGSTRGDEVAEWRGRHPEVVDYAIVDDIDGFSTEQKKHFVQTDSMEGLGFGDYLKLAKLFKEI